MTRTLPPLQRCPRCGRRSRMFNVRDCATCKAGGRQAARELAGELHERRGGKGRTAAPVESAATLAAREREVARLAGRLEFDEGLYARIHARWLARQPANHPWRTLEATSSVATRGGEAVV